MPAFNTAAPVDSPYSTAGVTLTSAKAHAAGRPPFMVLFISTVSAYCDTSRWVATNRRTQGIQAATWFFYIYVASSIFMSSSTVMATTSVCDSGSMSTTCIVSAAHTLTDLETIIEGNGALTVTASVKSTKT